MLKQPSATPSGRARLDGAKPSTLTPMEHHILSQIACGMSNRDIAEVNAITEKTVQKHLTNIYSKLGLVSDATQSGCADDRENRRVLAALIYWRVASDSAVNRLNARQRTLVANLASTCPLPATDDDQNWDLREFVLELRERCNANTVQPLALLRGLLPPMGDRHPKLSCIDEIMIFDLLVEGYSLKDIANHLDADETVLERAMWCIGAALAQFITNSSETPTHNAQPRSREVGVSLMYSTELQDMLEV